MSGFGNDFHDGEGGAQVKARLKWFNATKGFGFVSPVDGDSDAFLHVSVLQRAGLAQLGDQAELLCEVGPGPKGPQVIRIVEVLDAGQASQPRQNARQMDGAARSDPTSYDIGHNQDGVLVDGHHRREGFDGFQSQPATGPEEEMTGVVKWFKADKGFGFITAEGSGSDIFIHKSVLMRSGLYSLEAGQRVQMRVHEAQKGREATWIAAD